MGISLKKFLNDEPIVHFARDKNDTLTLTEFVKLHDDFIRDKTLQGLTSRTIHDHNLHLKYFLDYTTVSSNRLYDNQVISTRIFKNYMYYMLEEKKLKNSTINIRIRTLKCYLRWLFDNNYINTNIAMHLKIMKVPIDNKKPLGQQAVKKLLSLPNTRTYAGFRDFSLMILILDCGIRINELCNIKIEDVDIKNKLIIVRGEVSKTKEERILPISKQTVYLLKILINIAKEYNNEYVFNTSNADQLNVNCVLQSFKRYQEKMKNDVIISPYVLRHTFAVNAVKKGMDIFTLQRIMGHKCISTTRQYIQLNTTDIQQKHAQMNMLGDFIDDL